MVRRSRQAPPQAVRPGQVVSARQAGQPIPCDAVAAATSSLRETGRRQELERQARPVSPVALRQTRSADPERFGACGAVGGSRPLQAPVPARRRRAGCRDLEPREVCRGEARVSCWSRVVMNRPKCLPHSAQAPRWSTTRADRKSLLGFTGTRGEAHLRPTALVAEILRVLVQIGDLAATEPLATAIELGILL